MNLDSIIEKTERYVREKLEEEASGHDWWHIKRVYNNALLIASEEKECDLVVVKLAALLHDIADWKFNHGDELAGYNAAKEWLRSLGAEEGLIEHVAEIVKDISFKGAGEKTPMKTLEGEIVQDADRLDAMGAIGIARAFAYGGNRNREMYNPEVKPVLHENFEEYKKSKGTTINHFYEKLLLLKDLMNTEAGRKYAEGRHEYMEGFLKEFYGEWNGEV